jgi:dTDP-4-amino-4,6-dideoxygalactose transaminase
VIAVSNRRDVMAALGEKKIGCEIYYPLPMHLQECFAYLGYKKGQMPVAEKAAETSLSIPVFPEMTTKMQDEVVATILAVAK